VVPGSGRVLTVAAATTLAALFVDTNMAGAAIAVAMTQPVARQT
jgi:hypothetical protein